MAAKKGREQHEREREKEQRLDPGLGTTDGWMDG